MSEALTRRKLMRFWISIYIKGVFFAALSDGDTHFVHRGLENGQNIDYMEIFDFLKIQNFTKM